MNIIEGKIMSRKKNLIKNSLVVSALLLGSIVFSGSTDIMASNPTNYKDMTEYAAYENVIADAGATSGDFDEYSCAVTPQVRQTGNRLSGPAGTAYASLLT